LFWLFASSLTVYVTSLELGTGNNAPVCVLEMMDGGCPELSEHFGLSQFTLISRPVALSMVMSGGQKPHVGASVSVTSTVKEHEAEFPALSVTTYFTSFEPIPINLGSFVSTSFFSIVSTTLNKSTVIPGSFSVNELSLNVKFQLALETFSPLLLFNFNVPVGHSNTGG